MFCWFRYLWHIEDEPIKDVCAEIAEEFEVDELETARDALFKKAKEKVTECHTMAKAKTKDNDHRKTIAAKMNKRYADPWNMIKRRRLYKLAMDVCELYRFWIGKVPVFPYKMLRRKVTAMTHENIAEELSALNTIIETSENSKSSTREDVIMSNDDDLDEDDEEEMDDGRSIMDSIMDFMDIFNYYAEEPPREDGWNSDETPKDTTTQISLQPAIIDGALAAPVCGVTGESLDVGQLHVVHDLVTAAPDRPAGKEPMLGQPPGVVSDSNSALHTQATFSIKNTESTPMGEATGVNSYANVGAKQHQGKPANQPESYVQKATDGGQKIDPRDKDNPKPNPTKKQSTQDCSQESFLREIQEIEDKALTSSPIPVNWLRKKTGVDMATQTEKRFDADAPVMRSEFNTQATYTQGAITDHERRLKEHEMWRDRNDRKVDQVDAVSHATTKGLRTDVNGIMEEMERMKKMMLEMAEYIGKVGAAAKATGSSVGKKSSPQKRPITRKASPTQAVKTRATAERCEVEHRSPKRRRRMSSIAPSNPRTRRSSATSRSVSAYETFMRAAARLIATDQAKGRRLDSRCDLSDEASPKECTPHATQAGRIISNESGNKQGTGPNETSTPITRMNNVSISWADDENEDTKAIEEYLAIVEGNSEKDENVITPPTR